MLKFRTNITLFLLLNTLSVSIIFSQGLFNNGALIVITASGSRALIHIDGNANGNFTNSNGGTIDIDGDMEVEGNWTNNAANDVFVNNTDDDGWVKLNGVAFSAQAIGGSHLTVFENLEINHITYGATCGITNNQVNGQLKLTSGPLVLNSLIFIVNNTANTGILRNGTTEVGYIVSETEASKLQWNIGANTGTYTYPFGTLDADYIPFIASISAATGTDMTVSTWHTAPDNNTYASGVINMNDATGADISIPDVADRFWVPVYTNYTANFRFTYDAVGGTTDVAGLTESTLLAQYWNGTIWVTPPVGTNDEANDNVNSAAGQPRPWVLVDQDNPLPVELLTFIAVCDGEKVNANWSTTSETNNDYFTLERSSNAAEWDPLLNVSGAGNSNTLLNYSAEDNDPLDGISYYRLKQTDFDGAFTYSDAVTVGCSDEQGFELIAVKPGQQEHEIVVSFHAVEGETYYFNLYDYKGQLIKDISDQAVAGYNEIHVVVNNFAEGIYMLTLQNSNKYFGQKILLK
jgi:hypothetical protein